MSAREAFGLARRAFDRGDYDTAQKHSDRAAALLRERDVVVRRSSATRVLCSIVVVAYRKTAAVIDNLVALEASARGAGCELVLVNNGCAELASALDELDLDCTRVELDFNYGASGGRNIGAENARGEAIIFVDDDGVLHDGAVEALVACQARFEAVAVRGKVVPRTDPQRSAKHYDLGSRTMPALPTTEGISIWRRDAYLAFGGFDPLLYGHEGLLLACRMYKFHGPRHFLYTPDAVLGHDYYRDARGLKDKAARYQNHYSYLDFCGVPWSEIMRVFQEYQSRPELAASFIGMSPKRCEAGHGAAPAPISVLTTAKNGRRFVDDFSRSLRHQTHANFELVFVDDGSSDGTADAMLGQWGNDPRFRFLVSNTAGRGGALQTALDAAAHDICAIADIDDISVPQRLAWTADYFASHPESSCCSFYPFNESFGIRLGRPFNADPTSIKARSLVGMPVSFPTFAFRKRDFGQAFDTSLAAGIDCAWIFRNLWESPRDGHFVPLPAVYYRIHDAQITSVHRAAQRAHAIACVEALHGRLMAASGEQVREEAVACLSQWSRPETADDIKRLVSYALDLMSVVDRYAGCPLNEARTHLLKAILEIEGESAGRLGRRRGLRRYLKRDYRARKRAKIVGSLRHLKNRLLRRSGIFAEAG